MATHGNFFQTYLSFLILFKYNEGQSRVEGKAERCSRNCPRPSKDASPIALLKIVFIYKTFQE